MLLRAALSAALVLPLQQSTSQGPNCKAKPQQRQLLKGLPICQLATSFLENTAKICTVSLLPSCSS